ncbi:hypothetical protein V8C44DRAFT_321534 [Trichoderma aethiopicum]
MCRWWIMPALDTQLTSTADARTGRNPFLTERECGNGAHCRRIVQGRRARFTCSTCITESRTGSGTRHAVRSQAKVSKRARLLSLPPLDKPQPCPLPPSKEWAYQHLHDGVTAWTNTGGQSGKVIRSWYEDQLYIPSCFHAAPCCLHVAEGELGTCDTTKGVLYLADAWKREIFVVVCNSHARVVGSGLSAALDLTRASRPKNGEPETRVVVTRFSLAVVPEIKQ